MKKKKLFKNPARHYFWMNPYLDMSFTRCPKCNNTTKIKRIPLVLDADQKGLVNLNIETKYCLYCDLIIAKKGEVKRFVSNAKQQDIPAENIFVFGTLDHTYFRKFIKQGGTTADLLDNVYPFKDVLSFKVQPEGWYLK